MSRSLRQIVRDIAESPKLQEDWNRQLQTAQNIWERHSSGLCTVLLADEVGMGKTYVALASIANYIFQTDENNRKVLLVVPPNNILARKWEQEIRTFNDKYLHENFREEVSKSLRPMVVTDYWDLIRNLHDFQNQETPRVSSSMLQCFGFSTWKWHQKRRKKHARIKEWKIYGDVNDYDTEYLDFCSWYSPNAISDFLDQEMGSNPHGIEEMIGWLNDGNEDYDRIKGLFKKFGGNQDVYEANVFVIGMGTLRRTRISAEDSKLLNSYIASSLLKRYRTDTKKKAIIKLDNLCSKPKVEWAVGGNPHLRWFSALGGTNMWGMREIVKKVLFERGDRDALVNQILAGESLESLFKQLQDQVVLSKLKASQIDLAVVDEVHNWKGGNNGAAEFERIYAPAIQNKLIMSATPFQLHQDELGRVFRAAAGEQDQSLEVVKHILMHDGAAQKCLSFSSEFLCAWKVLQLNDIQRLNAVSVGEKGVGQAFAELRSDPDTSEGLIGFIDCAEKYEASVRELQFELSKIMIRHTKNRDKRHFHAGREYTEDGKPNYTNIRRTLYATSGFDKSTHGLLNFLAMRADQLVRRDTNTTGYETNAHLLGGITSSNRAFRDSNKKLLGNDKVRPSTKLYLNFFESVLDSNIHPKVQATVARAFSNFQNGLKTLIFCERLGTQAEILSDLEKLINHHIFLNGGFEQARRDRESILKDHEAVELLFSRSYLRTLAQKQRDELVAHVKISELEILESVSEKNRELGGSLNQRQIFKLLDLAVLRRVVTEEVSAASLIVRLFDADADALRRYLRLKEDPETVPIDEVPNYYETPAMENPPGILDEILCGPSIWYAQSEAAEFHCDLWRLIDSELRQLSQSDLGNDLQIVASILLDIGQGLRKILLRLDRLQAVERVPGESLALATIRLLALDSDQETQSSWRRTHDFIKVLLDADGSIRRNSPRSSKRQSQWKGVFLRDERIASDMHGGTDQEKRINLCAAFNSPLLPDILVCTSIGSEGIDLHRHCADVIHHDLPWNPAKLEQRTGRIDRVGSLAEQKYHKDEFRLNIGIPFLAHNYEQFQYQLLLSRAQKFEILLGKPDFTTDVEEDMVDENGNEVVLEPKIEGMNEALEADASLPEWIVDFLKMNLSVYQPSAVGEVN